MLNLIQSMEPLTEFAPTWRIPMWTAVYPNEHNIDVMRGWILDNEERLIAKYKTYDVRNDGGTGLGLESLTAQYNKFNLFSETQHIEAFQDLFQFIRVEYNEFMKELQFKVRDCLMFSWANVMRTGQTVNRHNHGASHYAYLSGNMHFDKYETITSYYNPYGDVQYDFNNIKGGITFFPSYLLHGTSPHLQEEPRVSMAFDLLDKEYGNYADANSVEFNNGL